LGITDASKVSARGDGLSLVPCHRPSLFNINAPGARMRDLDVKVTGRVTFDLTDRWWLDFGMHSFLLGSFSLY